MAESNASPLKGHGFTLLVLGVFVVVCSIFFVLGVIAGRSVAPLGATALSAPGETAEGEENAEELELSFYEAVEEIAPPVPEAPETSVEEPPSTPSERVVVTVPEPPRVPAPRPPSPPVASVGRGGRDSVNLQVAALRSEEQAERLRDELLELGLPAYILGPAPGTTSELHRVRVGPFNGSDEAAGVRTLLESKGYEAIVAN